MASAVALLRRCRDAMGPLLTATGARVCDALERKGLHPLMMPLAEKQQGIILGLLQWPLFVPSATEKRSDENLMLVEMSRGSYLVKPCGTPWQFSRRLAVESDAHDAEKASEILALASDVCQQLEPGSPPYVAGAFRQSKLRLDQFLLLRVGPFHDAWEALAQQQLRNGQQTAALIAGERASARNPGWGCGAWLQSRLMEQLGRKEERRDLALAALEAPFWTLGAPLDEVQAAAELSHVSDVRALIREMELKARARQGLPPPTPQETALCESLDVLDATVRTNGAWDDARPQLADALMRAGMPATAEIAALSS